MNLLKQTSLILGLASLMIGVWTIYRNWKQKLAIWYTVLCFFISLWALSFVSHATLQGRLSKDIHWFFHVWIVPVGVTILSKVLHNEYGFSRLLRFISFVGASVLSTMIAFSLGNGELFWNLVSFWPFLVVIEFLYVVAKDQFIGVPVSVDFFSPTKRLGFYFGLAVSLITCSFDHLPEIGYTIPAIGNLLLTVFLIFASQVISPQRLLNAQALVTRFFATVILSLVITGFFALLYQFMSESFSLFFLNSFLVTFAVLTLWNPLISFIRFIGKRFSTGLPSQGELQLTRLQHLLPSVTTLLELEELLVQSFQVWIPGSKTKLLLLDRESRKQSEIQAFFRKTSNSQLLPVIHRELIQMEKDQVVTHDLGKKLNAILHELDLMSVDVIFPIYSSDPLIVDPVMMVMIDAPVSIDDWHGDFSLFSSIFRSLQEVEKTLVKIGQIDHARERDRLILLGEMAAGLAHEVRNPLGAIQGAADLLESDPGPWVSVIRDEVQRLNRLVNQFLDFAHSPSDHVEHVNLGEILQRSIENLKPFYGKQTQIGFHKKFQGQVMVMGVPDHLQQILMNLIQNSIKAQSQNIEVEVYDYGFIVSDDGVGMPENVKEKVFQPFFTSFKTGTGLGLSICERLVKFCEGRISLESTEGVGTKVKVELCVIKSSS